MISRPAWYPQVAVPVAMLVCALALWPSVATLVRFWMEIRDYQHAFIVAPIVLVWVILVIRRNGFAGAAPSGTGCALLLAVLCVWLVSLRANMDIAHQLCWPLAVWAALFAAAGWRVALRFAAPLGLLYALIPVWDSLLPLLQRMSVYSTEHILAAIGVPAQVEEYRVTIPEGTFAIVEGCSGKRYLLVAIALAWLAAAMNHIRGRRLLLLFATSIAAALVINWIRIVVIIYAGHVSNMQHYLVAVEHFTFGNLIFLPLLAVVLGMAHYLAGDTPPVPQDSPLATAPAAWRVALPAGLPVLALAVFELGTGNAAAVQFDTLPLAAGRWYGPLPPRSGWTPAYAGFDEQRRVSYQASDGSTVELYVNLYAEQRSGKELVHFGNSLAAPAGWTGKWSRPSTPIPGPDPLSSFELAGGDGRDWVVAYTYVVGKASYSHGATAKLAYGMHSLFVPVSSGVIAVAAACDATNCNKSRTLLADFWKDMSPPIFALFPGH